MASMREESSLDMIKMAFTENSDMLGAIFVVEVQDEVEAIGFVISKLMLSS